MSTQQILFTANSMPFSVLIRATTWSAWSHCATVEGDTVVEALLGKGVVRTPLVAAVQRAKRWALLEYDCPNADAVRNCIAAQIGKPYDLTGVLSLPFQRDWQEDDAWWCSEIYPFARAQAGVPIFNAEALHRVAPQHLFMLPHLRVVGAG